MISRRLNLSLRSVVYLLVLLCTDHITTAAVIQWQVEDGANGHYYEHFDVGGITWTDANIAAENSSFMGAVGHLATITRQGEWDFVLDNFGIDLTWIGLTDQVVENDFRWLTGEPFAFSAWDTGPQEPNNAGNEDFVHDGGRSTGWGLNDKRNDSSVSGSLFSYLVEYPTPAQPPVQLSGYVQTSWLST